MVTSFAEPQQLLDELLPAHDLPLHAQLIGDCLDFPGERRDSRLLLPLFGCFLFPLLLFGLHPPDLLLRQGGTNGQGGSLLHDFFVALVEQVKNRGQVGRQALDAQTRQLFVMRALQEWFELGVLQQTKKVSDCSSAIVRCHVWLVNRSIKNASRCMRVPRIQVA